MKKLLLFLSLVINSVLSSTEKTYKDLVFTGDTFVKACKKCGIDKIPHFQPPIEPSAKDMKRKGSFTSALYSIADMYIFATNADLEAEERAETQEALLELMNCMLEDIYHIPRGTEEHKRMENEALKILIARFAYLSSFSIKR